MVYTITFNPSLDYIVTVDDFKLGLTNRTTSELMLPGGKGVNVSITPKISPVRRASLRVTCLSTAPLPKAAAKASIDMPKARISVVSMFIIIRVAIQSNSDVPCSGSRHAGESTMQSVK